MKADREGPMGLRCGLNPFYDLFCAFASIIRCLRRSPEKVKFRIFLLPLSCCIGVFFMCQVVTGPSIQSLSHSSNPQFLMGSFLCLSSGTEMGEPYQLVCADLECSPLGPHVLYLYQHHPLGLNRVLRRFNIG